MVGRARAVPFVAVFTITVALGGCGFGAGRGTKDASVQVTTDFGSRLVGRAAESKVPGSETVMSLTQRHFAVSTGYGGGFVESIDGHSGGTGHLDWFYYVNGIQAPAGAAATNVHKGDRVWWDLHDWTATDSVPAVIGSYPEPFTGRVAGKQHPAVLRCATEATQACGAIRSSLRKAGVKVSYEALRASSGSESPSVLVGTWKDLSGMAIARLIAGGPKHSGVYAQFVGNTGTAIELDDPSGHVVRTLHGAAGIVAATEPVPQGRPTWLVTGTNLAGVTDAARAFTAASLHDHFAIAVRPGRAIPIPVAPGS